MVIVWIKGRDLMGCREVEVDYVFVVFSVWFVGSVSSIISIFVPYLNSISLYSSKTSIHPMKKAILFITITMVFQQAWAQIVRASSVSQHLPDSVYWIQLEVDSGVVHAAIATPKGAGLFPAIIILHGTHGFAEEYVQLARRMAENGFIGIAACWFAGRRGEGTRFITPIECNDAPPLVDAPGLARFRIARKTIGSLVEEVATLPGVHKEQITLFGHSRGAGAALDYVLTHPGNNVQAIVLNSAGYPPEFIKQAPEVGTPVLILHGTADNPADGGSAVTDIGMARQFEAALRNAGKKVEVKYYEGGRHNAIFTDQAQFEDAVQRTSAFLRKVFSR
jgi:dienelactone hydrolase